MARHLLGRAAPMPLSQEAPRILAVDDDADTLHPLVRELEGSGCIVLTARDGPTALQLALDQVPDLIIVDADLPGMDGWTLAKHVRSRACLALIPFIFLTHGDAHDDRLRGFQLGADDFVRKPLRPTEIGARVHGSLGRRARIVGALQHHLRNAAARSHARGHVGITGTLEQVGLPALLTILETEREHGVLTLLRRDPPREASLYIVAGRVHDARLGGRVPLHRAAAVYELLRWDTGRFEFVPRPLELRDDIGLSTCELLLEGARRIDADLPR